MNTSYSSFSAPEIDRIIEMAWEDRSIFDAIKFQFNLRVEKGKTKQAAKRPAEIDRFKCSRQRANCKNKVSNRR
ncbi:DUF2805 domain-containing protein [Flavobacterium sp. RS13.1]|uniref:DUF2805 domain-containing protein n=1 Tax=Flavobacterium sp. RS13.1 TaxID=3400345 RepID=UPI003AACEA60